jgi:3-hydroxyacyl-CoA dehydrogenase
MRKEFGLIPDCAMTDPDAPRYSRLPDKLCEAGHFGQKTGRGWYYYDPAAPRKATPSADTAAFIENHRAERGISRREVSDQEIVERCLYPLVNEGFKILEEGVALRPEDIDVLYSYGYGFPRYRGGPM